MIDLEDRVAVKWRKTSDGYLVAQPRVARTGIQQYSGQEVGRPELKVVNVYRPADEVFADAAVRSYTHKPITLDHPTEAVTPDNWMKHSRGGSGEEVLRDGQFARVPMMVQDSTAIRSIESGEHAQISVGYACDLDWEAGTFEGAAYDAVQRNIRANHIALVKRARGGDKLRFGDAMTCPECGEDWDGKKCSSCGYAAKGGSKDAADPVVTADDLDNDDAGEGAKYMAKLTIDGISVEMTDTAVQVAEKALRDRDSALATANATITKMTADATTAKTAADTAAATAATQLADKDKEIADLKTKLKDAQVSPETLDGLVVDRVGVISKAKAILGDKLVIDGKSNDDIRKQVVDAHMGDAAKGWNEVQIRASFDAITLKTPAQQDGVRDIAHGFGQPGIQAQTLGDARMKAYEKADDELQNRWKKTKSAA